MGNALTLVFCAVVIFFAYLAIAIQFVVALVESYLVIGGGCILLGFGGLRWDAPPLGRDLPHLLSLGLENFLLFFLFRGGMTLSPRGAPVALGIGGFSGAAPPRFCPP